jgi:hypothetical protein
MNQHCGLFPENMRLIYDDKILDEGKSGDKRMSAYVNSPVNIDIIDIAAIHTILMNQSSLWGAEVDPYLNSLTQTPRNLARVVRMAEGAIRTNETDFSQELDRFFDLNIHSDPVDNLWRGPTASEFQGNLFTTRIKYLNDHHLSNHRSVIDGEFIEFLIKLSTTTLSCFGECIKMNHGFQNCLLFTSKHLVDPSCMRLSSWLIT